MYDRWGIEIDLNNNLAIIVDNLCLDEEIKYNVSFFLDTVKNHLE